MLNSLHIKNFRCFDDLQIKSLGRVNLIVGKNNVGKSTILEAMAVFSLCQGISDTSSAKSYLNQSGEFLLSRRDVLFNADMPDSKLQLLSIFRKKLEKLTEIRDKNTLVKLELFEHHGEPKSPHSLGFRTTVNSDEYEFYYNHEFELIPIKETVHTLGDILINALKIHRKKHSFCDATLSDANKLSSQLDLIKKEGEKNQLIRLLNDIKVIDSRIDDIDFISSETQSDQKTGILSLEGKKPQPLRNFGDGISRLLKIILHAYQAKKGYLLIDEFENGLHYSVQEEVWEKLFELAEELDIQVFATTHSQDAIRSFCKVALENKQIDGKLISLGRSAKASNKDQIVAVEFDEDQLKSFIDSGMEVRG